MRAAFFALAAGVLSATASPTLPSSPFLWLRPAELPTTGSPVSVWPNAVQGSEVIGASIDNSSNCYANYNSCASAPVAAALSGQRGHAFVNFTSPGREGLGSNLVVEGDYSKANQSYSIFFASSSAPGSKGQRILGMF